MVESGFPEDLPVQIADLFAVLYDWFEDCWFTRARNRRWASSILASKELAELARQVADSGWSVPDDISNLLVGLGKAPVHNAEVAKKAFMVLLSIDEGLRVYHPRRPHPPKPGETVADHYARFGMYNTGRVSGHVLPKWASGFRGGSYFRACFKNVVRARVPESYVHILGPHSGIIERTVTELRIAVIPYLYSLEDSTFEPLEANGGFFFKLNHPDKSLPILQSRIETAVTQLRASRVNIGIFPELALNDSLLKYLQQELRRTDVPDSQLFWVIAGSYCQTDDAEALFKCFNSAYVLDSGGNIVQSVHSPLRWVQHKRHCYKLTVGEQQRYKLEHLLLPLEDREEAISLGDSLIVYESRVGRYALLICEDFAQDLQTCDYVREMNCRNVIVLIMDGAINNNRWFTQRARFLADQTGVYVFVANSLLLPLRGAGRSPSLASERVALLLSPKKRNPSGPRCDFFEAEVAPGNYMSEVATLPLIYSP